MQITVVDADMVTLAIQPARNDRARLLSTIGGREIDIKKQSKYSSMSISIAHYTRRICKKIFFRPQYSQL
jgi:hypothetical protein